MRRLLGKVAPVIALAIAVIACAMPMRPAFAASHHGTSVVVLGHADDAARLDATTSSGPRSNASAQNSTDPATDPDQDSMGTEREAPEALPVIGGIGLVAPHASRIELRSTSV